MIDPSTSFQSINKIVQKTGSQLNPEQMFTLGMIHSLYQELNAIIRDAQTRERLFTAYYIDETEMKRQRSISTYLRTAHEQKLETLRQVFINLNGDESLIRVAAEA